MFRYTYQYNPSSGATARYCASSNKYQLVEVLSITLDVMNINRLSYCEEHTALQGPLLYDTDSYLAPC